MGELRGGSHCKWCANDIAAYFKNVIFFYEQKIPIPPFDIPLFIDCFTSLPLQAHHGEVLSLPLTKGRR